jgi:predicted DNA-binding transcriptional regulator YafY
MELVLVARVSEQEEDWDIVEYSYASTDQLLRDLLWHGDDVLIVEPAELREKVALSLDRIENAHG